MDNKTKNTTYLNEKWQRINEPSREDYAKEITAELKEIHSLIEELDISSDVPGLSKLPKMLLYDMKESTSKVKAVLAGLLDLAKNTPDGKDVSDLIH